MSEEFTQYLTEYVAVMDKAAARISRELVAHETIRRATSEPDPWDVELQRTKHMTEKVFPQVHRLSQAFVIFATIEQLFVRAAFKFQRVKESKFRFQKLQRANLAESFFYYVEGVLSMDCSTFDDDLRKRLDLSNTIRNHLVHEGLDATALTKQRRNRMALFGGISFEDNFILLDSRFIDSALDLLNEIDSALMKLEIEHLDFSKPLPY